MDFVDPTIGIDDTLSPVVVHSGRAHVVTAGVNGDLVSRRDAHRPKVRCSYSLRETHRHLIETVVVFSSNSQSNPAFLIPSASTVSSAPRGLRGFGNCSPVDLTVTAFHALRSPCGSVKR